MGKSDSLTIALGEYDTGWHDPALSLSRAADLARRACDAGAECLVLPEMCATGFTMDAEAFAEPRDGPSARAISAVAKELGLWIIAGLSTRHDGTFFNTSLAFAPDGSLDAIYDKQRLFGFARETDIYSPGTQPAVVRIGEVSLALSICFDLRFPELFREAAPHVDGYVLVANWPSNRQRHWEVLTQARAIENQCYMIAVNRLGEADGLTYEGGSVILDPWGERIDAQVPGSSLRMATVSHSAVAKVRRAFPLSTSLGD